MKTETNLRIQIFLLCQFFIKADILKIEIQSDKKVLQKFIINFPLSSLQKMFRLRFPEKLNTCQVDK